MNQNMACFGGKLTEGKEAFSISQQWWTLGVDSGARLCLYFFEVPENKQKRTKEMDFFSLDRPPFRFGLKIGRDLRALV